MICDFSSFSIVFQSYQYGGQVIMKDCVQLNCLWLRRFRPEWGPNSRPLDKQASALPIATVASFSEGINSQREVQILSLYSKSHFGRVLSFMEATTNPKKVVYLCKT